MEINLLELSLQEQIDWRYAQLRMLEAAQKPLPEKFEIQVRINESDSFNALHEFTQGIGWFYTCNIIYKPNVNNSTALFTKRWGR